MNTLWRPGNSLCVDALGIMLITIQSRNIKGTEYHGLNRVDALVFGKVLGPGDRAETVVGKEHCEQNTVTYTTALPVTDSTHTANDQ